MSIVLTEVESIHGGADDQRMFFFRCQDHLGAWHSYGPVITVDPQFNAEAHKAYVSERVAATLAADEANKMIGA